VNIRTETVFNQDDIMVSLRSQKLVVFSDVSTHVRG